MSDELEVTPVQRVVGAPTVLVQIESPRPAPEPPSGGSLKKFIESHPLPVLFGVAFAAVSATAAVVSGVATTKFEGEKAKIEADFKNENSQLKSRLASIERKLGNDDKTYFDVSQLVLAPDRIKTLEDSYKTSDDGSFYYIPPAGSGWTYEKTSEGGLLKAKMEDEPDDLRASGLLNAIAEKNVNLWQSNGPAFKVLPRPRKGMEDKIPASLKFAPMVYVETFDEEHFKSEVGAFAKFLDSSSEIDRIARELDAIQADSRKLLASSAASGSAEPKQKSADAPPVTNGAAGKSAPRPADASSAATADEGDRQIATEQLLEGLFRGDIAQAMLMGLIGQNYGFTQMIDGSQATLKSVQKKGNVLYVQTSLKFNAAKLVGFDKPMDLTVEREIFVVSNSKHMYLVVVEVPSVDGRSPAYNWVGQWLSSVRIPV